MGNKSYISHQDKLLQKLQISSMSRTQYKLIEKRTNLFFFKLGSTPCKAEQPLQGMELQGKKAEKIKAYRKSL